MQLSPIFNLERYTTIDPITGNSVPLNGGRIFAYEAGSFSVLKTTYADQAGLVANPNPIVLNSAGVQPTAIWLEDGEFYNLVLTQPDGTTVITSYDNVSGVYVAPTGGGGPSVVWIPVAGATYLSPTSFLVPGDFTQEYAVGNRARVSLTGGLSEGTVSAVSFSSGNTTVVLQMDSGSLDPSLSNAEYSVLTARSPAVDAGGVSYFDALPYSLANTVGWKLKQVESNATNLTTKVNSLRRVWDTTGTGGAYEITPSPVATSYSVEQVFTVKFVDAFSGAATLDVNGLGATPLRQYDSTGAAVNVSIPAGLVSDVGYDGTNFILLDPPPAVITPPPRGAALFTSNDTWICPANVTVVKVTCVAGGGGGGLWTDVIQPYNGGPGGRGASSMTYVSVTPASSYTVAVGAGGAGATAIPFAPSQAGGSTSFGGTLASASGGGAGGNATAGGPGTPGTNGSGGTGLVRTGSPDFSQNGAGGVGATAASAPGGAGGAGLVYLEW